MTRQLQHRQNHLAMAPAAVDDPLVPVLAAAAPTLTAVAHLKPAVDWVVATEKKPHFTLDARRAARFGEEAEERLKLIPPRDALQRAVDLFEEAKRVPADEPLLHLAIGVMLSERPNAGKVSPAYRRGLVDSLLHDEEFAPGPSAPVLIRVVRELRKATEFVPALAEFLKACTRQKRFFADLRLRTEQLMAIRETAEKVLAEEKRQFEEDFGPWEPIEPKPPGWRALVHTDDSDLPF